jgi:hypothetical protein
MMISLPGTKHSVPIDIFEHNPFCKSPEERHQPRCDKVERTPFPDVQNHLCRPPHRETPLCAIFHRSFTTTGFYTVPEEKSTTQTL